MIFTTLTSVLALASFASAAAPSVTYPHTGITWENSWWHNVTWAPQSGTGSIQLSNNGKVTPLKSNVDLSTGRTVIQVPGSVAHTTGYIVQIVAGGDTSSSDQFAIGDHPSSGAVATSASGSASSAVNTASSIVSSASSAVSSALSSLSAASGASSAGSATSSIAASASSDLASVSNSLASAGSSVLSSLSAAGASATSSVSSKAASAVSSATSPASTSGGAKSGAAPLGVSVFGVAVAAGLMAVTTLSGALVL